MGTRGFRAWRLRKRYYAHYNQYDSYPRGLGQDIAGEIPSDHEAYAIWLAAQREMVGEWERQWD